MKENNKKPIKKTEKIPERSNLRNNKNIYQLSFFEFGSGTVTGTEKSSKPIDSKKSPTPFGGELMAFDVIWNSGFGLHISPFNKYFYDQELPSKYYTNTETTVYSWGWMTTTASIWSTSDASSEYYFPVFLRYYFARKNPKNKFYCGLGLGRHTFKKDLNVVSSGGVNFSKFNKEEKDVAVAINIGIDSLKDGFHPIIDLKIIPGTEDEEGLMILLSLGLKYGL